MSETFYRLLFIFIDVILPLTIGYYFHKYKIISLNTCNFLLKIKYPFHYDNHWTWQFLVDKNRPKFIFIGIRRNYPHFSTSRIISLSICKLATWQKIYAIAGAYLLSSMLSNTGILGGLCAYIAMGQLAYAYVQVIAMAQNIFTLSFLFSSS